MSVPGILSGGQLKEIFLKGAPEKTASYGVFGPNPGATPKVSKNTGRRDAENRDTMARLFLEVNDPEGFMKTVPEESKPLARVLMSGTGTGGAAGTGFFDFLMTNTQENFSEKAQIIDTLTDNYVLYFGGREPTMGIYNGVLLNTYQDDQRVWFLRAYSSMLRGTQLAARNLIARLRYDSFLVSGYLLNLNMGLESDTDITASRFSFQMVIKRMQVITPALFMPTGFVPGAEKVEPTIGTEENLASIDYDAREGVVTPEVPPTASEFPASYAAMDASIRLGMTNAAGQVLHPTAPGPETLPPSTLDPSVRLGMAQSAGAILHGYPGTDPRYAAELVRQEGRDRVTEKLPPAVADSFIRTTLALANAAPDAPSNTSTRTGADVTKAPLRHTPAVRLKGRTLEPATAAAPSAPLIAREVAPATQSVDAATGALATARSRSDTFASLDLIPPGTNEIRTTRTVRR